MGERLAEKRKAFDWFGLTKEERFKNGLEWRGETRHIYNRQELAKFLGIKTVSVIDGWYKEWEAYEKSIDGIREDAKDLNGEYNFDEFLKSKKPRVTESLIRACEKLDPSPTALQIYFRLTKDLVERSEQEVTHKLDAESLFRIREEAHRRLSESNRETDRDRSLFTEQHVLSEKIRKDT